jgi:hypothetical protein
MGGDENSGQAIMENGRVKGGNGLWEGDGRWVGSGRGEGGGGYEIGKVDGEKWIDETTDGLISSSSLSHPHGIHPSPGRGERNERGRYPRG